MYGFRGMLVAGAFFVVLVAACSDSPTVAPDACATLSGANRLECWKNQINGSDDPCRLITASEVRIVTGYKVEFPGRTAAGKCFNVFEGVTSGRNTFEYAFVNSGKDAFESATRGLTERVSGVGDSAFWDEANSTLHALKGEGYFWIKIEGIPRNRDRSVELAKLGLTNVSRLSPPPRALQG